MLCNRFDEGFPYCEITKGLINLIPKEGDLKYLKYWRPIILLAASYKMFAKTLQLRLQRIIRDVINPEQTTFLPLRFILDNIILTQETLHWSNISRQPTVFLKLEISKAYDKIFWHFLTTMHNMGISEVIIKWVKLLFTGATAAVNLNDNPGDNFKVERGIKQGCLLALYIFL